MATAGQFEAYLRDSFDVLYAESERYPRMMSIGLHCRVIGRPGRSPSLDRFIDYAKGFDGVWFGHARGDRPLVARGARRKPTPGGGNVSEGRQVQVMTGPAPGGDVVRIELEDVPGPGG